MFALGQTFELLSGGPNWRPAENLTANQWKYYAVDIENWHGDFNIYFNKTRGNVAAFIRFGQLPTETEFDARSVNGEIGSTAGIHITNTTPVRIRSGRWYIGIRGTANGYFKSVISRKSVPSHVAGMGSVPDADGTSFRTHAPFAGGVSVAGQFNNWSGSASPLVSESNGNYSIFYRNATAGQQYKYVIKNGINTYWRQDPYSPQVTNSIGNSVIYNQIGYQWESSEYISPNWNDLVIYEMHIGTFNDLPGGAPGTFNSAIQRLNYLQDLGVNAIELMPINEFPGDFSWGYNPSHPFAVETAYGGPNEFKRFVDEAHKRGIAVLLDVVHNHYGPNDLDLWQYDGWSQNGYGGLFFYNDNRAITPWGNTRPDFGRGSVRQYIRDNALMWLEEFRLDGSRWDSVLNIRTTSNGDNGDGWSLMQWINDEINARQPWKINIAEDLQGNEWITKSTGEGGAGFDSQWSPTFVHPMRPLMTAVSDSSRNMNDLSTALTGNYNGQALQRTIYTESHDEVANGRSRVPQEIDPGNPGSYWARKRSTLGAVVTMTAPGIPMLFQGQEILEDGYFQDSDPIDWSKEFTYAGVKLLYKDLIRLRRNLSGKTAGLTAGNINLFHVNDGAKVAAYHRWQNGGIGDDVVMLINFSNTQFANYEIGLPRSGIWNVVFNSDWNGYGSDYLNTFTANAGTNPNPLHGFGQRASFALGPYSAVILTQAN